MPSPQCRECGTALSYTTAQCPSCGCRTPFACAVCHKPLGSLSLGVLPSAKHPRGAFSEDNTPLCHDHRLTRCHACGDLHPMGQMLRKQVGEREDRENRPGMRPRLEPVFGYFCAPCQADARNAESAGSHGWLVGALVLAAVLLIAYFVRLAF